MVKTKFFHGKIKELNCALKIMRLDILHKHNIACIHSSKRLLHLSFKNKVDENAAVCKNESFDIPAINKT